MSAPRRAALLLRRVPNGVWLGAVVVVVTCLNVWWRVRETRPPHWDMAYHLANSLFYRHDVSLTHPIAFLGTYRFYPPLTYWITDLFYVTLGNEAMWVAVLGNVVWLAVLVFATFAVGRRLWSVRVGWLSVVFVLTAPMIVSGAKEVMLDLPLTAMAALLLYLLIRAEGFSSRRYSLLLGAAFGFGLLVKWTLPLVLLLPVLHALVVAVAAMRRTHRLDRLVNLAGAAALAFVIAGTWYVRNVRQIGGAAILYNGPEGALRGNPRVASAASALWYLWNLLDVQLYLVPLLLVLVGVGFCIGRRGFAARNLYPILMVVGTYVTFSLLRHKDPRYTLPMLPALALIATSWIEVVATRARTWLTGGVVAYGAVAFLAISFGTSLLPRSIVVGLPHTSFAPSGLTLFAQSGYIVGPPTRERWHQEDALRAIARFPAAERSFSYRGPDTIWFNADGLRYYAARVGATRVDPGQARMLLVRGRHVSTPTGVDELERWPLPDGGTLVLYRRG